MLTYEKIATISETQKSHVYLAAMPGHEAPVVIKELTLAELSVYERLSKLQSPFFPQIYACQAGEPCIIAEEYVEGVPMDAYAAGGWMLAESDYLALFRQLCEAAELLHAQTPPIIHRDLKPQNLLVDKGGQVKIIDFDSSRSYTAAQVKDTRLLGTEGYAAPEQFGYTQTDARSDIYTIGVTMYEVLFGAGFPADRSVLSDKKHASTARCPQLAVRLLPVIRRCTQFNPDARYPDAAHLKKAILSCRTSAVQKRRRMVAALCGALLLLFCGAGLLYHARSYASGASETVDYSRYEDMATYYTDSYDSASGESVPLVVNYLQSDPACSPFYFSLDYEGGVSPTEVLLYDEEEDRAVRISEDCWEYDADSRLIHISDDYLCSLAPGRDYAISFIYETLRHLLYIRPLETLDDLKEQSSALISPGWGVCSLADPRELTFTSVNALGRKIQSVCKNGDTQPLSSEECAISADGTRFVLSPALFADGSAGDCLEFFVYFEENPAFAYNDPCHLEIELTE